MNVSEGQLLAGKYRVERVLGQGGMGVVVAAHHIQLDERVALKFLLPEALENQEAIARFAREARAAVKIKSEHVARVSDVGTLENGVPYIVMEYLEGSDLSAWLSQRGALPFEQAVDFVLQACEAIAEAHALGIVHRDLKPANLFVVRRADNALSVKVLDFGISKMTSVSGLREDAALTKTSALMGSPRYMSPEQMQSSKEVDARSDIWALGVILYELVTGETPFRGSIMPELILQIMSADPAPMSSKAAGISNALEAVILKCLAKDRDRRYESVGQLAVALLPFAPKHSRASVDRISGVMLGAGYSASTLALPQSDAQNPQTATGTAASWGGTSTGKSRSTWWFFGVGAVLVAGVIAMALRRPTTSEGGVGSSQTVALPTVIPAHAAALAPPVVSLPAPENPKLAAEATPESSAPRVASAAPPSAKAQKAPAEQVTRTVGPRQTQPTAPTRPVAPAVTTSAPIVESAAKVRSSASRTEELFDDRK